MSGINLKTLSAKLGLSQTTVSRALNGYPEVNENTRRRILQAAEKYKYRPNAGAKGLATGRTMRIGHVIAQDKDDHFIDPAFGDFIAGAGEVYASAGYDMVVSVVRLDQEYETYKNMASKRSVDGVILTEPRENDLRPALLIERKLPFVVHGRVGTFDQPYGFVDVHSRLAFQRATDFLLDLGHTRIALFNGPEGLDIVKRRRVGFEKALAARGLQPDRTLIANSQRTETLAYRCAREMLALKAPPTAFLVSSIMMAMGVRRALDDLELSVGQDISILAHDEVLSHLDDGNALPVYTATRSSVRDAGRRCAEMLIHQIANPFEPPLTELWDAKLTLGKSTGLAPKS